MTRGDCKDGPRPCVRLTCRYHLLLEKGRNGGIRLHPEGLPRFTLQPWAPDEVAEWFEDVAVDRLFEMRDTCALDVADRGEATLDEVAEVMGISRQRAQQVEAEALVQIRVRPEAAEAMGEGIDA